jgi:hypothetical protein
MTKKKDLKFYKDLAASRNHMLINCTNNVTPSKGCLELFCNNCQQKFTVTAHSYQNAKVSTQTGKISGCPNCKKIAVSKQWANKPRVLTLEQAEKQATIKAWPDGQQATRDELAKKYDNISDRNALLALLKEEQNEAYAKFIEYHLNNPPKNDQLLLQEHHIIPKHAGGVDSEWNIIKLTPSDHVLAHKIRFEVYGQPGDEHAARFASSDVDESTKRRIRQGDETRKAQSLGIYAQGVSSKGGKKGGTVKTIVKDISYQKQMNPEVKSLLENGSNWYHEATKTNCLISPNEVRTLTQLKDKLANSLPKENESYTALTRETKNINITSNLSKVIKGTRNTAFGWKLVD